MTPIDLLDYTRSSHKIPSALLKPVKADTDIKSWKILLSYAVDFMMVVGTTNILAAFLKLSFHNMMITHKLGVAFKGIPFGSLTTNLLPLMFVSYFFFCFFFNNGQSFGLKSMKARITMPEMSFRSSLAWAAFSASVVMSFGITFSFAYKWMQQRGMGQVKSEDHLYHDLMMERTFSPVDLVEMSESHTVEETEAEEIYLEAA